MNYKTYIKVDNNNVEAGLLNLKILNEFNTIKIVFKLKDSALNLFLNKNDLFFKDSDTGFCRTISLDTDKIELNKYCAEELMQYFGVSNSPTYKPTL